MHQGGAGMGQFGVQMTPLQAPHMQVTPLQAPHMQVTPPQAPHMQFQPPMAHYTPPQAPHVSVTPLQAPNLSVPSPALPAKAPVNWLLIAIVGLAMFIAGALIVMLLVKK